MLLAPFVYDGMQARLAEAAGFEAVYMTGFGTAAARGLPDLGFIGLAEMAANARILSEAVAVPVICDADTGYGNALNAMRTVREVEAAGAAALHIEDQVWPKRCGFFEGKQVVPRAEMEAKVRAAVDARSDPDLVIIARTDALQPEGWDAAEQRARAYREAGADLVFLDGIHSVEDLDVYAERLHDLPCVYNGQLLTPREVEARGFRLQIHIGTLPVAWRAMRDALEELRRTGAVAETQDGRAFAELVEFLGVRDALERASKYET
ncbi:MAG: isocitrate lyase/PEP mutase family protein [Deltaproteobacteria bacterium]|nr:isocitrate lyase/PEP mutase family protein [Deltaproteobacteria bacterium]MBW2373755.1 isocitrate lyase/PEP mutase family protein [Deltaproteobacteria bacterium]